MHGLQACLAVTVVGCQGVRGFNGGYLFLCAFLGGFQRLRLCVAPASLAENGFIHQFQLFELRKWKPDDQLHTAILRHLCIAVIRGCPLLRLPGPTCTNPLMSSKIKTIYSRRIRAKKPLTFLLPMLQRNVRQCRLHTRSVETVRSGDPCSQATTSAPCT